jgi:RNA polymerase sigma-70 factor (ECF subfamily)
VRINDNLLIKKTLSGNPEAFGKLVVRYQQEVFCLCFRFLKNRDDASDAAQEVFIKAYNRLGQFKFKSKFSSWLYRICVNTCLDELRSQNRLKKADRPVFATDSSSETPHQKAETRELLNLIQKEAGKLPGTASEVMRLKLAGESYQEIAEKVGITAASARALYSRGKKKLQDSVKSYMEEG